MSLLSFYQYRASLQRIDDLRGLLGELAIGERIEGELDGLMVRYADVAVERHATPTSEVDLRQAHIDGAAEVGDAVDAVLLSPLSEPPQKEAAQRIRDVVVQGRRGIGFSARQRYEMALEVQDALPRLEPDFAALPQGIKARVLAWVELGLQFGDADTRPRPSPRRSLELRKDTRSFLARTRRAIRSELEFNPDLPQDLEAQLLGYLDGHLPQAGGRSTASATPQEAPEAPAAPAEVEASVAGEDPQPEACDETPEVARRLPDPQPLTAVIETA